MLHTTVIPAQAGTHDTLEDNGTWTGQADLAGRKGAMTSLDIRLMRSLLPVLNEIDDQTLSGLDRSEWYRPSAEDADLLRVTADRLGVYLMTYRADGRPRKGGGLCNLIAAASLKEPEISEITRLEAELRWAVIVAYARPTRRCH